MSDRRYKLELELTAADLTPEIRNEIKERQNNVCFYCGGSISRYVLDHFIPRSKGGGHDKYNRVAACSPCDWKKGARLPTAEEVEKLQSQIKAFP